MNENNIEEKKEFMRAAIRLSIENVETRGGGPFGAVVVKDGKIIAEGYNQVTGNCDPTAHAEVQAIRNACEVLGHFELTDCDIYTSCEPCPMCLGAIYWARPRKVYFGNTKVDAANIDFDDQFIYDELEIPFADRKIPFEQLLNEEANAAFKLWSDKTDKVKY